MNRENGMRQTTPNQITSKNYDTTLDPGSMFNLT